MRKLQWVKAGAIAGAIGLALQITRNFLISEDTLYDNKTINHNFILMNIYDYGGLLCGLFIALLLVQPMKKREIFYALLFTIFVYNALPFILFGPLFIFSLAALNR